MSCYHFLNDNIMFGWFKKKSEKELLQEQYKQLMEEAFRLSRTDRRKSDELYAEAEKIQESIQKLP